MEMKIIFVISLSYADLFFLLQKGSFVIIKLDFGLVRSNKQDLRGHLKINVFLVCAHI